MEPAASNDFEAAFEDFRKTVVVHAREEEDRVFPLLAGLDPDKLHQMATLLAAAKDTAPTASPRTCPALPMGKLLAGPPAAIIDRSRDAIRAVRNH